MSLFDKSVGLHRFGLGPKAGGLDRVKAVDDELEAELAAAAPPTPSDAAIKNSREAFQAWFKALRQARTERERVVASMNDPADPAAAARIANLIAYHPYREEADLLLAQIARPEIGFVERLVHFWANHFAVAVRGNTTVLALAGSYLREAIRPYVLGRFGDMLLAVARHPAMLSYLNNAMSIGPNSQAGRKLDKGLNENFARELMELHTLGVDGGYTQADVESLARILTGWSYDQDFNRPTGGQFQFKPAAHEPGPKTLLGKTYPESGYGEGEAALRDLARHPSTARHVSFKLAKTFVSDDPPQALCDRLAATFLRTDGDLAALARTLVQSKEAWAAEPEKLKSPQELVWATMRGLDVRLTAAQLISMLRRLGQPLWDPPSPAGFPSDGSAWLSSGAMVGRLEFAQRMVALRRDDLDPRNLTKRLLGERVSAETRKAIELAESRSQGLVLLIMSPEFQRR